MPKYLIIGGNGYIGRNLAQRLRKSDPTASILLADLATTTQEPFDYVSWDVRKPAPQALLSGQFDWIYNFAAVHREPGHEREEYFDTNVPGAEHVIALAEHVGCKNLFFTSSIAVYGPTKGPTEESTAKYPTTGYGISKLLAEGIHQKWQARDASRKLVICRPGVIYGPGEKGNIPRMVRAIRKGIFVFPGNRTILKSYGYIEGLLDSIQFSTTKRNAVEEAKPLIIYNYVETPTEPLVTLANEIAAILGKRPWFVNVPIGLVVGVASVTQVLTGGRSPIHPARVRKVATPTHIIPRYLIDSGFQFNYPFAKSLSDWKSKNPSDFS